MSDEQDNIRPKGFDDYEVTLGDELRGERATRGKSLLDVQRDLRIKAAYIAAIENCDASVFPNPGFVAGYVRSYARYLGVDPDVMYRRFCRESGFEGINANMSPRRSGVPRGGGQRGSDPLAPFGNALTPQNESILNAISPSGVASVLVLVLLIGGIGYGGWSVIQDIQRVEFAPIDHTPGALVEAPDFERPAVEPGTEVALVPVNPVPDRSDILGQLYRPHELEVPQVQPRDGPIAAIDPDTVGIFRPDRLPAVETGPVYAEAAPRPEEFQGPVVTVDLAPPPVEVVAVRAAWVRVFEEDGTVLHEKILEAGERYRIPREAKNPMLRAGNSGSVFLMVDNQAYGPVGRGTSVAKRVQLGAEQVQTAYVPVEDVEIPPDPTLRSAEITE